MLASETLAEGLFNRAKSDGLLTNNIAAKTINGRGNTCHVQNSESTFGVKAQTVTFWEVSKLLMGLGSGDNDIGCPRALVHHRRKDPTQQHASKVNR
ncbi:hypothetical protein GN244_ATG04386 [Phytophthora infestans]|uniref:Uncharacterized protein n=1 Tax=Phytophthora infestans TaxID=4787 RepID=A0A833T6R7_PHYIN|nr:hypothetical protein GN244_ATG04386 [Phytophthora infestans]KAF4149511.1 hypothetical protein GN958_ATG01326 [Phytophthora infestans]